MKGKIIVFLAILFLASCTSRPQRTNSEATEILSHSWVLPLVNEYYARKINGVYNLYKENTSGALQVSSMAKSSEITDAEILDIAKSQVGNKGDLVDIAEQNKRGYRSTFVHNEVFWIYWFIVIDRSLILVTYNADSDKINKNEIKEAEALVNGISASSRSE